MVKDNVDNYIVGIGHPRCGTGYTASLLQKWGKDVGHEYHHQDGIVSWMIASNRSSVPWGDGVPIIKPNFKCFTIARSPIDAIPSMIPEASNLYSFGFRAQVIWQELGIDITNEKNVPQTEIGMSLGIWALWMKIVLNRSSKHIFRIDRDEDLPLLAAFLGLEPILNTDNIHLNSRPEIRDNNFKIENFSKFPVPLAKITLNMCLKLGYQEDHAKLIAIYEKCNEI